MIKKLTMLIACLCMTCVVAMAQTRVTGTVVSQEDGLPIVGATVQVVGTSQGALTDVDGKFTLDVPSRNSTLRISYVGMQTMEVTAAPNMRVMLLSDDTLLDEVVVTAMGITRQQKTLGYSAQTLDNEELVAGRLSDVTSALAGKVAGVQVNASSSDPGTANSVISVVSVPSMVTTNRCMWLMAYPSSRHLCLHKVRSRPWVVSPISIVPTSSR